MIANERIDLGRNISFGGESAMHFSTELSDLQSRFDSAADLLRALLFEDVATIQERLNQTRPEYGGYVIERGMESDSEGGLEGTVRLEEISPDGAAAKYHFQRTCLDAAEARDHKILEG